MVEVPQQLLLHILNLSTSAQCPRARSPPSPPSTPSPRPLLPPTGPPLARTPSPSSAPSPIPPSEEPPTPPVRSLSRGTTCRKQTSAPYSRARPQIASFNTLTDTVTVNLSRYHTEFGPVRPWKEIAKEWRDEQLRRAQRRLQEA